MKNIEIGVVTNPQGIKGEVRVKLYSDNYDIFNTLNQITLNSKVYDIERFQDRSSFAVLKLSGVTTANEAELLRQAKLFIKEAEVVLEENEVLVKDIIGYAVINEKNVALGKLIDITTYGANEVYTVLLTSGKELMFPNARGIIIDINMANKSIVLDSNILKEIAV